METESVLLDLVTSEYRLRDSRLQPLAERTGPDQVVFRVSCEDGPSFVLHAVHEQENDRLTRHLSVLRMLETVGYPAPRPQAASSGSFVAEYRGWAALLVTYVEGAAKDFSLRALRSLGATTGLLHASTDACRHARPAPLPRCRLDPAMITAPDLQRIEDHPLRSKAEFRDSFDIALSTIERLKSRVQSRSLPVTLLHGDCWPANAVLQPDGTSVLVDWEFSGKGPALVELGFLLMASHIDKPLLPVLIPDPERIAAVLDGYSAHYRLNGQELSDLADAVTFDPSRRLARLVLDRDTLPNDGLLPTLVSRIAAGPRLAEVARAVLNRP